MLTRKSIPDEDKINKYLAQSEVPAGTVAIPFDRDIYRIFRRRNIPVQRKYGYIILPPAVAVWWQDQLFEYA